MPKISEAALLDDPAWHSRTISWALSTSQNMDYDYYAGYVPDLELWFITGKDDYYSARDGIPTEQLVAILRADDVTDVWKSTEWQQLTRA